MKLERFDYSFRFAGLDDVGRQRESNQDEVILAPELGLFAVSDGMGGLDQGDVAAAFVKEALPGLVGPMLEDLRGDESPEEVARMLKNDVAALSDHLYMQGNSPTWYRFGATVSAVLLYRDKAIFLWLGDSRGYLLPRRKRTFVQATEDMNLAALLVKAGELTREQAARSPASSQLTAFVGMEPPASPETVILDVKPGDRLLLCSDGLYGMVNPQDLRRLMRSSRSPERVCRRLIDRANENGGRDNISAVYLKIV